MGSASRRRKRQRRLAPRRTASEFAVRGPGGRSVTFRYPSSQPGLPGHLLGRMQRIADVAWQQDRAIDEQIEELRDRLASVPALQLLANLSFHHLAGDPNAYREYEAEPVVFVEYPTWLYLTLDRPTVPEGEFIDARVSEPIYQLVRSVIYGTMWEIVDEGRHGRGGDNPALARLRMQTRLKDQSRPQTVIWPGRVAASW
jgi:hypothetical protein